MTGLFQTLKDFFPDGLPPFLQDLIDAQWLDAVYIEPLSPGRLASEGKLVTRLRFDYELPLAAPGCPGITLVLCPAASKNIIEIEVSIFAPVRFDLLQVPFAFRVRSDVLRPVQLSSDGRKYEQLDQDYFDVSAKGSFGIDQNLNLFPGVGGFAVPHVMVGQTGLVLALENVDLILSDGQQPEGLAAFGYGPAFRGIFAETGSLHWLPGVVFEGSEFPGIRASFAGAAIGFTNDTLGLSCRLTQTWIVEVIGDHFGTGTELQGYVVDPAWSVAISRLDTEIVQNEVQRLTVSGLLRVPPLAAFLCVDFGLRSDSSIGIRVYNADSSPVQMELGGGNSLTLDQLHVDGVLQSDQFAMEGMAAGTVNISGVDPVSLSQAHIKVLHVPEIDQLELRLTDLDVGPLGTLETATLKAERRSPIDSSEAALSIWLEATLVWSDLQERLNLGDLPEEFPLPPSHAAMTVLLSWEENGKILLRFSADLAHAEAMLTFIPEPYRPEVRNLKFVVEVAYDNADELRSASSSGMFEGDLFVDLEILLPEPPNLPGSNLFVLSGDWIKGRLQAAVREDGNTTHKYLKLAFDDGSFPVGVNLPGLSQSKPLIEIGIASLDFSVASNQADDLDATLTFAGPFHVHPLNPAETGLPVPPPMAAHMEKVFRAAGLQDLSGEANVDLHLKNGKSQLELSCTFAEGTGLEIDLFDMMSSLTRGRPAAKEEAGASTVDLDIDVDVRLREIALQIGSINESTANEGPFSFELGLDLMFGGIEAEDFRFKLSSEEFSFGFARLPVAIALPHFPLTRADLDQLRDASNHWDYQGLWSLREQALTDEIKAIKGDIQDLKEQLAAAPAGQRAGLEEELRQKRKLLFDRSGQKFLIESIFVFHQLVGEPNRSGYQLLVEAYMDLMDKTLHQFSFDTKLDFVLSDVRFVLPFNNPTDIRVEGGARITGFPEDDPLAPLGEIVFKLGLSADAIYFSIEAGDEPIPLPVFGYYTTEAGETEAKVRIRLNHAHIGYGYTKNALNVALAGELKVAREFVDQLDVSKSIGIGVRIPEQSRVGFKIDVIPVTLGEVDFLLPLLEFDVDLRRNGPQGVANNQRCQPYWDGLQLIVSGAMRQDVKRLRFAPFFGALPAANVNLSVDLALGDEENGLTFICDNYLVITGLNAVTTYPMFSDGTPFFDNLCVHVSMAGFGVHFNLQRPFPSMSPLALFEIFGLIADPAMKVDPDGNLASIIRATIQDASIELPPFIVRMFPECGTVLGRKLNHTVNLGSVITAAQAIAGPVSELASAVAATTEDVQSWLNDVKTNPPTVRPGAVLTLLPPELRRFHLEGSFAGFDASATFVLLSPEEAADEFNRRDNPTVGEVALPVFEDEFDGESLSGWKMVNDGRGPAKWVLQDGELRHVGKTKGATFQIYKRDFKNVIFSTTFRSSAQGGIGVLFGYQNQRNHYRFVMTGTPQRCELAKVLNGKTKVLFQGKQGTAAGVRFSVKVRTEPLRGRLRIRVFINDVLRVDVKDSDDPFVTGKIGLYCKANSDVRFGRVRILPIDIPRLLETGNPVDAAWLLQFEPNYSGPHTPAFNPSDLAMHVLNGEEFEAFDASSLNDLTLMNPPAAGVLVGAQVRFLENASARFLGYVFHDGTFKLISTLDLKPLELSIAGITFALPLQVSGRLRLNGRSKGADSFAIVTVEVWGTWSPVPGVIELRVATEADPAVLEIRSNGRFAAKGAAELSLFNSAATITGSVDISQTHCLVAGEFVYVDHPSPAKRKIELQLDTTGRIGPEAQFEVRGSGTLRVLGNTITAVKGLLSQKGVALEASLGAKNWDWNGISINEFSATLSGFIDITKKDFPSFLLAGNTYLRVFGTSKQRTGLEISGRGGIRGNSGRLAAFVEGDLFWQGREWLGGSVEVGTDRVSLKGRTTFSLDLTPDDLPGGISVAHLFFHVELSGAFVLSTSGGLETCELEVDWLLGVRLPSAGMKQQTFPVALQKFRLNFPPKQKSNPKKSTADETIEIAKLMEVDGAFFLPFKQFAIPVPEVKVSSDGYTKYYWYWRDIRSIPGAGDVLPASATIPALASDGEDSEKLFEVPTGWAPSSQNMDSELGEILEGFAETAAIAGAIESFTGKTVKEYIEDTYNFNVPKLTVNATQSLYGRDIPLSPELSIPWITTSRTEADKGADDYLFQIPRLFTAQLPESSKAFSPLSDLKFTIALAWKKGKLGLAVSGPQKNSTQWQTTFTAFEKMFRDS